MTTCPVGCTAPLANMLLRLRKGQLLSSASAARYNESMTQFDDSVFNVTTGHAQTRRDDEARRRLARIAALLNKSPQNIRLCDAGCSRGQFIATAITARFSAKGVESAPQAQPRRILVIVTRRIGDVLLATPLIRSLKRAWPDSRIEVLVFDGTQGVLAGNPDIAAVHVVAERPRLSAHLALLARLFRQYDLALSLVPSDRPTLYAWIAGRRRIGLLVDRPDQRWKQFFLDRWVAFDPDNTHTVRNHLALAGALDIPAIADIVVAWRDTDAIAVDALLQGPCSALAVLHAWPKFRYKMWCKEHWLAVARWFLDNGMRVALTGSPDPAERAYVDALAQQLPDTVINAAGKLTLGGTAALIARAQFYVGPDTAITHLAAATGVPTVALFGPTDPVKWGPWPKGHAAIDNPWQRLGDQRVGNVQLVQGRASCVPCGHEGCARRIDSSSDCLQHLPASSIINYLKTMAYAKPL